KRLLIVDDDSLMIRSVSRPLSVIAGEVVPIHTAQKGEDALQKIEENQADTWFVITDFEMPGMNGAEFLRQIIQRFPNTKVTSVIRSSRLKREIDSSGTGCDRVLSKIDMNDTAVLTGLFQAFCGR
ncbi:MAG: response regulator, partial [bacterium]|nr:response regulator [bacterium]